MSLGGGIPTDSSDLQMLSETYTPFIFCFIILLHFQGHFSVPPGHTVADGSLGRKKRDRGEQIGICQPRDPEGVFLEVLCMGNGSHLLFSCSFCPRRILGNVLYSWVHCYPLILGAVSEAHME